MPPKIPKGFNNARDRLEISRLSCKTCSLQTTSNGSCSSDSLEALDGFCSAGIAFRKTALSFSSFFGVGCCKYISYEMPAAGVKYLYFVPKADTCRDVIVPNTTSRLPPPIEVDFHS